MEEIFGRDGILAKNLPEFEIRPSQLFMAKAVKEAMEKGECLLVEAGTGTGKSLAYLVPAFLSDERVVVSTYTKNLQEQLYFKDIPFLKKSTGLDKKVVILKGRENYLCTKRLESLKVTGTFKSKSDIREFSKICKWSEKTKTGDRNELDFLKDESHVWQMVNSRSHLCHHLKCTNAPHCFLMNLKREALKADIIIVNHFLYFADLSLTISVGSGILPSHDIVIFDEAHEIEDVVSNYFGFVISNFKVDELIGDFERELFNVKSKTKDSQELLIDIRKISDNFFAHFSIGDKSYRIKESNLTQDIMTLADDLLTRLSRLERYPKDKGIESDNFNNLERRAYELSKDLKFILELKHDDFVYWCEIRNRGIFLHANPIDVSEIFSKLLLEKKNSIILTSATLTANGNFDFLKSRLGINSTNEHILESHFDFNKQAVIYIPKKLPDPNSSGFVKEAATHIIDILNKTKGRAFVLFTSYYNMEGVFRIIAPEIKYNLLKQGDKPKSMLIQEFKNVKNSVLLATYSFWQGVDVQGEALSCVIIDKLPFAVPSEPVVEAKIEFITKNGGNAFLSFQVPSAIIMLKQGFGRLIRNKEDTGVLSILDGRILSKFYGKQFLNSLPPCTITRELTKIEGFLKQS
ncbi:ATP-dependent DNA helicase [bacterium]|nr:ATP-dependent DNA helicase [bacterium]